jgi:hypothetical protein
MKRRVNIETILSELVMVKVQYKTILKNILEFLTEILGESRLRGIQHLNMKDNKIYSIILELTIFSCFMVNWVVPRTSSLSSL